VNYNSILEFVVSTLCLFISIEKLFRLKKNGRKKKSVMERRELAWMTKGCLLPCTKYYSYIKYKQKKTIHISLIEYSHYDFEFGYY